MTKAAAAAFMSLLLAAGCSSSDDGDPVVTVMAASSLSDVVAQVDEAFRDDADEATPPIRAVVAASSALVAQLEAGVEADILITANAATINRALDSGWIAGEVVVIATNRIVLALAPGNPGGITSLDALSAEGLLIGACAVEVPCGALADQAIEVLELHAALDTRELNVRALATKIALGELDAGFVYATDAIALQLEIVAAGNLDEFVNEYLMASVLTDPPPHVQTVLDAFGRESIGARALAAEGFGPP